MGQPGKSHILSSVTEFIGNGSERGEVKHLSTLRKRNQFRDYPSSGERTGKSLNQNHLFDSGVVGPRCETVKVRITVWKVWRDRVIAPCSKTLKALAESRVPQDT